jgi:Uma2 family endonuclease
MSEALRENDMVTAIPEPVQRLVLYSIPWGKYDALLHALDDRHLRITFDRGTLEIMTISYPHEFYKKLFARLIELLAVELNIPLQPGGSLTFRREMMEKGLEPDECYWIERAPLMQGKLDYDIEVDPPPDLAIEIDITSSSLDRVAIYAALGVREVWRFDGETLLVYQLVGSKYKVKAHSRAFPFLPMREIVRFVKEAEGSDQTTVMRAFSKWVRETLLPKASKSNRGGKSNGHSKA